jgi:hypothetical protein
MEPRNLKIDMVQGAYSQMRISGITTQPTPEEVTLALERLENMAAEWENSKNMCFGYYFENNPDPNTLHNIARQYWQCFQTNLAVRLLQDFGKQAPAELVAQARQSLSSALASLKSKALQETRYSPRQARGSGNTLRYNQFQNYYRQQENAPYTCELIQMTVGEINDYVEDFTSYVRSDESVSDFQIKAGAGLSLVSATLANNLIDFRLKAGSVSGNTNPQRVNLEFRVTTSLGRQNIRYRPVEIAQEIDIQLGGEIDGPTGDKIFTSGCGESFMQCGESQAQCGEFVLEE